MQEASQPEYQERRIISDLERKLRRMTILVGLIGSDGIILAADQRLTQPARDDKQLDDREGICKIVNLEKHKVAYARVGDYVSRMVGDEIAVALDQRAFGIFEHGSIRLLLTDIADSVVKAETAKPHPHHFNPDLDRSLLIVFYGEHVPERQLWRLRISPPYPAADRIATFSIQGAIGNRARFFDHYYREGLPIETLALLASHVVLTAGRVDSGMIHGLDVALFDKAGFRLLDENQKALLRERSKELDALIRRRLLAE